MEEAIDRQVGTETSAVAENLAQTRNVVSYFREVIPLLLGGTEGELSHLLSQDESEKTLARLEIYRFLAVLLNNDAQCGG